MRQLFSCIILIVVFSSCNSQTLNKIDPDFNLLNQYFKKNNYVKDSLAFPLIHQNDNYSIQFASQSLNLNKNEIQLSNPYSGGRFPLAFSLLFDGHLITLFDNGKFACHNLTNFKRNLQFEELLNRRKFDYAWIIDGSIVAKYNYEFFQFDRNNLWTEYKNAVPFCKKDLPFDCKPKLFEDNQYLVYQKCEGEFGGAVFFYNKQTGKTYQTQTSCSNSIIKKGNKYQVLSHLGHMSGSSDLQVINNLDDLKETPHVPKLFDYWGIQTFASFLFRNQAIYMVHWRGATFLATLKNGSFLIVDPLFDNDLYTHNPVTTSYKENVILINLDFYGKGGYKEVSCILIEDNNLTKINWKEN